MLQFSNWNNLTVREMLERISESADMPFKVDANGNFVPTAVVAKGSATAAITGTTTETAFDHKVFLKGGSLVVGSGLHIKAWGKFIAQAGTTMVTLRLRYGGAGGVQLLPASTVTPNAGNYWFIEADLICESTGTAGKVLPVGKLFHNISTPVYLSLFSDLVTVDTTTDKEIVVTATLNLADATSVRMDGMVAWRFFGP